MNIKIIGAGAMGSIYAAMLGKKHDVTLIDNYSPVVDEINARGLTIEEADGSKNVIGSEPKSAARTTSRATSRSFSSRTPLPKPR